VDLQEADMETVLAQIGQQTSIRMSSGPSAGKKVSARFSGVELEEGIRRLLRSASLNHVFMYSGKPGGSVTISEVRILGEGKPSVSSPASVMESGMPPSEPASRAPAGKGRRQAPEIAQPIQEATPEPEQGEPTEITRRVREVFQFSKGMGNKNQDVQEPASNEPQ
jgi:hypothetical protein